MALVGGIMSQAPVKPSLTIKSLASMMQKPAFEQVRILTEQKYPKRGAAPHRRPYYSQAHAGIRSHYEHDRSPMAIENQRRRIQTSNVRIDRKEHNLRALQAFVESPQSARILVPGPRPKTMRWDLESYKVELRLRFDIEGEEGGRYKHIFYNTCEAPIDEEIARTMLELAYWTLDGKKVPVAMRDLEYVDLASGKMLSWARPRKSTWNKVEANAKVIATLWSTL
jgi:hypothetical protein